MSLPEVTLRTHELRMGVAASFDSFVRYQESTMGGVCTLLEVSVLSNGCIWPIRSKHAESVDDTGCFRATD